MQVPVVGLGVFFLLFAALSCTTSCSAILRRILYLQRTGKIRAKFGRGALGQAHLLTGQTIKSGQDGAGGLN